MYKKLTALILSLMMVSSMLVSPAAAYETNSADIPVSEETYDGGAAQVDPVEFVNETKKLPEVSRESAVFGDYEYEVDTSVNEVIITKYNGEETSVTVPDKIECMPVVRIGNNAFENYARLREVKLPKTLTSIGSRAFKACARLETADVPDTLEEIDAEAFYDCVKLKAFSYPKSWTKCDSWGSGNIFYNCESLTSIEIPEGAETVPPYALANSNCLKSVTLPSTLTKIEERAFLNCPQLKSIVIPDGVTVIGAHAFSGCSSLNNVDFGSGITAIEYAAFYSCERLETADLPDSVEAIGGYAFERCTRLSSFTYPKKWEKADGNTFRDCTSLTEMIVPEGVTAIPAKAFQCSPALDSVSLPSTLKKIGNSSFYECTALKEITLPAALETIEEAAFEGCSNLRAFTFPASMESVPPHVLKNCTRLEEIVFPSAPLSIGREAFQGCERLTEVVIPSSVEALNTRAFANCKRLETVTLPIKWETAEESVFENCEALTHIIVPEGVKALPDNAFFKANYLEQLDLPSTLTKIGYRSVSECGSLTSIEIPASVKTIGNEAFRASGFKTLTLPDAVTEIPDNMARECSSLEDVVFSKNLKTVGYAAFYRCERLTDIDLPDTVENIKGYAFEECRKAVTFHYPASWENTEGNIFKNADSLTEITVPEGVKALPNNAFLGCNKLEKVQLPSTLTTIGELAFRECTSLKSIEMPDSVKTIGSTAFEQCSQLKEVKLPASLETLARGVFFNCERLERVEFNDKLTSIGYDCFARCPRLAGADLPDTVEYLDGNVFSGDTSLSSFTYPRALSKVDGSGILRDCENLTSVTVPEGVTAIPENTFRECNKLVSVTLPSTLTKIGNNAFRDCNELREVTIPAAVASVDSDAFANCPMLTVYCPKYRKYVVDLIDRKINIISTDDSRVDSARALDASRSSYAMLSGSKIAVSCSYAVKTSVYSNISETYVKFYIPDGASVADGTVYLNGKLCTDMEENDNYLRIPVSEKTGRITFSLAADADCMLRTYAIFGYRYGNSDDLDIIDVINEDYEIITLDADNIVSSNKVEVSGMAPAENNVDIFVNGSLKTSVQANKAGVYTAIVDLGAIRQNERASLRAETLNKDGDTISASKSVKFVENAPELTGFEMNYNGLDYDLLSGKKHNVVFVLEGPHGYTPFTFTVNYAHNENIDRVYVTSTRNQITKKMLAKYDPEVGAYVAKGHFDPNDHDYVPGKIGVEYLEKPVNEEYSFSDLDTVYNGDMLPEILKNATHELTTDEETHKVVLIKTQDNDVITYTYDRLTAAEFKSEYESRHGISSASDKLPDMLEDYGWSSRTENGVTTYAEFDRNANGNQTIVWSYRTSSDYVERETIEFGTGSARKKALLHVSEEDIDRIADSGLNYAETDTAEYIFCSGYTINYTTARANIISSSYSQSVKNRKLEKLNELRRLAIEMTAAKLIGAYLHINGGYLFSDHPVLTLVIYVINFTIPGDNGEGPGGPGGPGGNDTDDTPGTDTDDTPGEGGGDDGDDSAAGFASGTQSMSGNVLSFSIDPSGYVYEAVTSNRISGAKVTAYWIPYDGEDTAYWEKPDESKAVIWNSDEYSQLNPLYTDNTGSYAWDVPEGWWRIVVEKDGYEEASSDWLPVPPPQTDVNICLVSKEAPKIESVETTETTVTITFSKYIDPATVSSIVLRDKDGNAVAYDLDYSKDETNADGDVFAKTFTLTLKEKVGKVTLEIPNDVKSYSGKAVEAYTEELKLFDEPEPIDSDSDTDDTDTDDTDPDDSDTDTEDSDTDSDSDNTPDEPGPQVPDRDYGDVDGDGSITASDALMILRYSAGMGEPDSDFLLIADVDGDGQLTAGDALAVLRCSAGMEDTTGKIGKPIKP